LLPSLRDITIYDNKTTKVSPDIVEDHLAKKVAPVKIERILTDCGIECPTWHEEAIRNHEFEKTCVKIPESIRGEQGVEENLPFTYDSVEAEHKNKEVLKCQLVTTS